MDPPILPPLATPDSFLFPYSQPYSIQLDLMRTVFRAIEERKIAIVSGTALPYLSFSSSRPLIWRSGDEQR